VRVLVSNTRCAMKKAAALSILVAAILRKWFQDIVRLST